MLRITRLTDYAIAVLGAMAGGNAPIFTARQAAKATGLPLPAVSKILKSLAKHGIVASQRGVLGGYRIGRQPAQIALSEVIDAIEGPIALTECGQSDLGLACEYHASCAVQVSWARVNRVVRRALSSVTIADMVGTGSRALVPLRLGSARAAAALQGDALISGPRSEVTT